MLPWLEECRKLGEDLKTCLYTDGEFSKALVRLIELDDSPVTGLVYEWKHAASGTITTFGRHGEGSEDYRERHQHFPLTLRIWSLRNRPPHPQFGQVSISEIAHEMWGCFDTFLPSGDLNGKSELRDFKNSQHVVKQVEERFSRCVRKREPCSCLFFDLDGFKEVNDQIGYDQGDAVIKRFGMLLVEVCGASVVPLHNGGDEFLGFFPSGDAEDAMDLALEVIARSGRFDFHSRDIQVGVSIGVTSHPDVQTYRSLSELVMSSEIALKAVKAETKGTARFPPKPDKAAFQHTDQGLKLAICLIKSCLGSRKIRTFGSPWLNILAERISRALASDDASPTLITEIVRDFLTVARLEVDGSILVAQQPRSDAVITSYVVSLEDLGFAISNGIFHAALRRTQLREAILGLTLNVSESGLSLVSNKGDVLWTQGSMEANSRPVVLGRCWWVDKPDELDEQAGRVAILAQIGHESPQLPSALIATHVVIDDRPTRGGGLPDFWELTLGRILESLDCRPNVSKVFVMGNTQWAKKSIEWLTSTGQWDTRYIEYKTTLLPEVIERGKARLSGNVHIATSLDEVLDIMIPTIQQPRELLPAPRASGPGRRTLRREIQMRNMVLKTEDGCRVNTIAQAYAVVLEILRGQRPEDVVMHDQAGQPLKELVDFKVELLDPLNDMVPEFYKQEEKQLIEYYNREFRSDNGIFWRELQKDAQYSKVVAHIADTISTSKVPYPHTTRRALLVVPHIPLLDRELAPLGLVAVRCVPRIEGRQVLLHFSYVWRTVEALVGFPYSLYGSVRFAADFVVDVQARLSTLGRNIVVKLGRVSYIAFSLHMFMDEFALQIARKIVSDATE